MKAALDGARNLCVPDGWWEAGVYSGNGWAIPSADRVDDPARRDELEASALYDLVSQSVGPLFYDRGPDGLPRRWLEMVAHTLRTLGPRAQATRMVREYVTELYLPAARASQALAAGGPGYAGARQLAAWKDRVTKAWPGVGIEHVEADETHQSTGARLAVRASVALGELSPDEVTVQVVYGTAGDEDEIIGPAFSDLTLDPEAAGGSPARLGPSGSGPWAPGPWGPGGPPESAVPGEG